MGAEPVAPGPGDPGPGGPDAADARPAPDRLGARTWTELPTPAPLLLVPIGATEQHGPHLPLDTDTRIAAALAARAADRCDALLAPALAYGASGEHEGFAGTISLGNEALATVLIEYGRSAHRWADRVLLVNGHGGNVSALAAAVTRLRTEGRDTAWWTPVIEAGDAHAGRTETAMMAHLHPDLVRTDRIVPGRTEPLAELWPELRAGGVAAVSPSGVLGDPVGADPAEGARLVADLTVGLCAAIEDWSPGDHGRLG